VRFIQCGAIGVNVTATCFLCPQQTGRSLLVPVIYSIFVLDLKLVKWERYETAQTVSDVLPAAVLQAAE